jgi:dsDNA-specific endonuclease/ATPase MutS2
MNFKQGDKVSFLNEKGFGVIAHILSDGTAVVRTEDGFDIPYPLAQLVYYGQPPNVEEPREKNKSVHPPEKLIKQKKNHKDKSPVAKPHSNIVAWEVDLHIHELVDSYKHLANSQMLAIQLSHCRQKLEEAIEARVRKIYFIHGVGNGVLKSEVRKFLESYKGIEYYDAPYRMFGFGATEVIIK